MSVTDDAYGEHVVIEAAKTTASAGELWVIVVVAVGCLAFWLGAVAWADLHPIVRRRQVPDMQGPVLGGMHLGSGGRSVSPNREAPSVLTNVDDTPYDQRDYEPEHDEAAQWREGEPGTYLPSWLPVQRGAQSQPTTGRASDMPEMPAQRTGEADRAERSATGPADQGRNES
jgi:hypothetical protein